jgi:8-oxo-dGTP diphosphatase
MSGEAPAPKQVVAGVIVRAERVLVCQRREDQTFPLQWKFPGGKVEAGEELERALARELDEELGIDAMIGSRIATSCHHYANDISVELHFFRVDEFSGEIENRIFRQIRWLEACELEAESFLEADRELVRQLREDNLLSS